jgi:hypothetical protein
MIKYIKDQIEAMTPEQLKRAVATDVMGLSIYHYDKDVEERCYYMLWDENMNHMAKFIGYHTDERKTEEEAWADCPDFINDFNATFSIIEKLKEKEYGVNIYVQKGFEPEVTLFVWRGECGSFRGKTLGEAVCKVALVVMK